MYTSHNEVYDIGTKTLKKYNVLRPTCYFDFVKGNFGFGRGFFGFDFWDIGVTN